MALGDHTVFSPNQDLGVARRQIFDVSGRLFVAAFFTVGNWPLDNMDIAAAVDINATDSFFYAIYADNGSHYPNHGAGAVQSGTVAQADWTSTGTPPNPPINGHSLTFGFAGSGPTLAAGDYWFVVTPTTGGLQATANIQTDGAAVPNTAPAEGLFGASLATLATLPDVTNPSTHNFTPDMALRLYFDDTPTAVRSFVSIVG